MTIDEAGMLAGEQDADEEARPVGAHHPLVVEILEIAAGEMDGGSDRLDPVAATGEGDAGLEHLPRGGDRQIDGAVEIGLDVPAGNLAAHREPMVFGILDHGSAFIGGLQRLRIHVHCNMNSTKSLFLILNYNPSTLPPSWACSENCF